MARIQFFLVALVLTVLFAHQARAGIFFTARENSVPINSDIVFDTNPELAEDEGHPTVVLDTKPYGPNAYDKFPQLVANKAADDVCITAGLRGGCSACEHDTLNACVWVTDEDFQLKGACVSKETAEVITKSATSVRMVWPAALIENSFEIIGGSYFADTFASFGYLYVGEIFDSLDDYFLFVKQINQRLSLNLVAESNDPLYFLGSIIFRPTLGGYLCPAPGSNAPELNLAAPSFFPAVSKTHSRYAKAGYCTLKGSDLPYSAQTLHYGDRFSAENVFNAVAATDFDQCNAINSRNGIRAEFLNVFYTVNYPSEYFTPPQWDCADLEGGEVEASPADLECLELLKSFECNLMCSPYGKNVPAQVCPDTIIKMSQVCSNTNPRLMECGLGFSIELLSSFFTEDVFIYIEQLLAGEAPVFEGECFDVINNGFYEVDKDALIADMHVKVVDAPVEAADICTGILYLPNFAVPNCLEGGGRQ